MSAQLAQALKSTLRIDYENDTGPVDEGFWEWWSVIDEATGETLCICDDEATAKRILAALAAHEASPQQEPDCWAILTPNGSKLVSPDEAKGRKDAYPLYAAPQQAQSPTQAEVDLSEALIEIQMLRDELRLCCDLKREYQERAAASQQAQAPIDPDGEQSRAGFRAFDESQIARWATPWQVWREAVKWAAQQGRKS